MFSPSMLKICSGDAESNLYISGSVSGTAMAKLIFLCIAK